MGWPFRGCDKGVERQVDPGLRPRIEVATRLEALGNSLGSRAEFCFATWLSWVGPG